jgi:hypothetical protein
MFDSQVDLRVAFPPDPMFQLCLPSVVAEKSSRLSICGVLLDDAALAPQPGSARERAQGVHGIIVLQPVRSARTAPPHTLWAF